MRIPRLSRALGWAAAAVLVVPHLRAAGTGYTPIYPLNYSHAAAPAPPIQGTDGRLYGVTTGEGANGLGSVYAVQLDGSGYTTLYSFTGGGDGASPIGNLVQGADGRLYGTTSGRNTSGAGTVFALETDGTGFATLYAFAAPAQPNGIMQASDGRLYGTTLTGGSGQGSLFVVGTDGSGFATLYAFTGVAGQPNGPPTQGGDGRLYGTCNATAYSIATDGSGFTELSFANVSGPDLEFDSVPLRGSDGRIYFGGYATDGMSFLLVYDPSGSTPAVSMNLGAGVAAGPLVEGTDGRIYGTAWGAPQGGCVFAVNTDGSGYAVVASVASNTSRLFGLIQGSDGRLYGAINPAYPGTGGSLFAVQTNGSGLVTLDTFPSGGVLPSALILASDGRLYGTTAAGGAFGASSVFGLNPDGSDAGNLYSFGGVVAPSALIQGGDGRLYGTTQTGGANGDGSLFALAPDGSAFATLYSFAGAPAGPTALIQGSDGRLYGATSGGGANGAGTIFAVNADGSHFAVLYSFTSALSGPSALIQGSDGRLYGTASQGGTHAEGGVFAVTTSGAGFVTLYDFTGASDGGQPQYGVIQGSDGRLYGATTVGGESGAGTLFSLNTDGSQFSAFYSTDVPLTGLIQGSDGRLYGTGANPSLPYYPVVLAINPDGTGVQEAEDFTGVVPAYPFQSISPLVEGPDGSFYGTLENDDTGVAYKLNVFGAPLSFGSQPSSVTVAAGQVASLSANASFGAGSVFSGPFPVTYQWYQNGVAVPGATRSALPLNGVSTTQAGVYTVVASNSTGSVTSAPATVAVTVDARLMNLSSLATLGAGQELTVGFSVAGTGAKSVLVRGDGPALAAFGVTTPAANPVLTLYDGSARVIATDSGWANPPALGDSSAAVSVEAATSLDMTQVGAFALPPGSADSALLAALPPGIYSVSVGSEGGQGTVLAELYDAGTGTPASRLVNLSGLSSVNGAAQTLSVGFVVGGTTAETLLVRAVGPGLAPLGVSGALAAPQLAVYDTTHGWLIATNGGWSQAPALLSANFSVQGATAQVFSQAGAFALPAGSADCAMVVTVPPGTYSAVVTGVNGAAGMALAEIYEVP